MVKYSIPKAFLQADRVLKFASRFAFSPLYVS